MRSDMNDIERALPRRDFGQPTCINKWCASGQTVRVQGEHCRRCLDQQQRHKDAMRAFREKRQAAS